MNNVPEVYKHMYALVYLFLFI